MAETAVPHSFGGNWTTEKLVRLEKYLGAYQRVLQNQPYTTVYVDAFAGTGYRTLEQNAAQSSGGGQESLFHPCEAGEVATTPGILEELLGLLPSSTPASSDGSARIALQVPRPFDRYVFVEKNPARCAELEKLKLEYAHVARCIDVRNSDAITEVERLCAEDWSRQRAVMFLDPYGMQVPWSTVERIGKTRAIDLWMLVPLGIGVNRLLRNDGEISPANVTRLNTFLGASDWYEQFYSKSDFHCIFDGSLISEKVKVADFESIKCYFMNRLREHFAGVAENPRWLCNSHGVPLFLLCFAVGNPKATAPALRIAQHILK